MNIKRAIGLVCIVLWSVSTHADSAACDALQAEGHTLVDGALPQRVGTRVRTSGSVPHTQLGVDRDETLVGELHRRAYLLPGVEKRPTIVSLPTATGMWLDDDVPVAHPSAIVSGREYAHIHEDGSLHVPLPYERALEVERKGWGERHPWADRFDGWEGLVMLYSATDDSQLQVLIQLITESYNYVTGQSVSAPHC